VREPGRAIMSGMSTPAGWGPSHQTGRRWSRRPWWIAVPGCVLVGVWFFEWGTAATFLLIVVPVMIVLLTIERIVTRGPLAAKAWAAKAIARSEDPLAIVRAGSREDGGGVYLGVMKNGDWQHARPERAVLLLGPPRSGKTSGVIIPGLLSHTGPAVCTSTKPDVARATARARSRFGRVWIFDPTGANRGDGSEELRWSPVRASANWDGALLMARAMTAAAGVGSGTTHGSHWAKRSQALLAPFLHAAALDGRDMESVVDWVMRHELDEAGILLEQERASRLAFGSLIGLLNTEDRERASIFSAAAGALQAYNSEAGWRRRRTRTSRPSSSSPQKTRSTFTRPRRNRPPRRRSCAVCWQRSAVPPTTPTKRQACPGGCCSHSMRWRTSRRWRSCRRSPQKAAAKGSRCSPRCRTSLRLALAGVRRRTGS
jgi:Type IV secretory system Conjugative DNA transfer